MDLHFRHYQLILSDEQEQQKYSANILRYINAYTEKFIADKKKEILFQLEEWYGKDALVQFKVELWFQNIKNQIF